MARNTEKGAKCETNTIRHGIWRETVKTINMRNNLGPGLQREKSKNWKMRHKHSMRWNMARDTEKRKK